MNTVSTNVTSYSVEGILFHYDSDRAIKQHFHVYNEENVYLGHGKTGKDGRFYVEIRYPAALQQKITLIFRLCREDNPVHRHEKLRKDEVLCRHFSFYKGRTEVAQTVETFVLDKLKKDLGEVHLERPYKKEQVPLRYKVNIATASVASQVTAFLEKIKEKMDFFDTHDIDDVIKAFGFSSTELTSENTWKMITNGICPIYLKEEEEHYVAEVDWSRYEFDKLQALADIKVWFKKSVESDPVMDRIEVRFRETLEPSSRPEDYTPIQTYSPDQENFEEGLRIANCAFHVFGQTVFHLGIGHIYGANAAIAAFDYLPGHPLGSLLLPHCHFIRKISKEIGGPIIFEEDGVLNVSALSVNGIASLISDALASLDPFSFKPRSPINDNHTFAKVQKHHFEVLKSAVKEYFDENWDQMVKDWAPVHGFFRRMFKNSPSYRPWGEENSAKFKWRDSSELGDCRDEQLPPRVTYRSTDEGVRSFRLIAADEHVPLPGDREFIEHFVVDFIHHVTIWHSWIHRSQYLSSESSPSVADVNFAPLSLSFYGKGDYGGISMEDAIHQLEIASVFSRFNVGNYALVDGEGVYSGIIKKVKEAAKGYFSLGIDPFQEIQVSTVI